jgi:5-deoxy-glucuronate isomerase
MKNRIVLQDGAGDWSVGERQWAVSRKDVFTERATALYLPAGAEFHATATTRMEAILMSTPAPPRPGAEPALVGPADVRVNARGKGHYTREVHDLFVDDPHAARLMVGETFNPPGNWSSYPPHKHDGADGEPRLEEVYHSGFRRPWLAHQSLHDGRRVRDAPGQGRRWVLLPYGYHPVFCRPAPRNTCGRWPRPTAAGPPEDPATPLIRSAQTSSTRI